MSSRTLTTVTSRRQFQIGWVKCTQSVLPRSHPRPRWQDAGLQRERDQTSGM